MTIPAGIQRSEDTPGTADAEHNWLQQQVQHLLVAVEHELRAAGPAGLSELELIRALQSERWGLIGAVDFHEPDRLYPVHFLLFHTLYCLRDQIAAEGESLTISPLRLSIHPQNPGATSSSLPESADKLRAFYLDLSQYFLSDTAIHEMMDNFWSGSLPSRPGSADAAAAGRALGFDELPRQFATVKQRFRKLVMRAHPDRGGDTGEVQQLNQAFSVLKAHYA
ncbi:DNA-J related domain-containing protein [Marinobacter sp. VGCF2001]|uniref:DNA-J related domain-containing protein n=1 Tax=Marinobacter sp. VGCF2001 TaxID=3417189 RepID=UPI003CF88FA3